MDLENRMKRYMQGAALAAIGGALLGCNGSPPEDSSVTIEQILVERNEYVLLTPEPVPANQFFTDLCISLPEPTSPHAATSFVVTMNSAAANSFRKPSTPYPVGSVVLKSKQSVWAKPNGRSVDDIGGMVKRAAGYDPGNGDWEYFYVKGDKITAVGKLANCIDCHTNASDRDYVFGTWSKPHQGR